MGCTSVKRGFRANNNFGLYSIISSNSGIFSDREENEDILTDDNLLKLFNSDSEQSSFDGFESN